MHLEDSRVGEAARQDTSLAQQALNKQANVQGKGLMVGHQKQRPIQGYALTALLHAAVCHCGEENRALQLRQGFGGPAEVAVAKLKCRTSKLLLTWDVDMSNGKQSRDETHTY